jgi:molybdopterin converting factor small subunit
MIEVTVHYFAILKEQKQMDRETQCIPTGTSVEALYRSLFESSSNVRFAVNELFVPAATQLQDGDQVAFLPPLGGG